MNDYDKARCMFEECFEKIQQILGQDHPSTLIMINNLALCYKNMGNYENAKQLYEECVEKSTQALGEDHPDTLTLVNNLTVLYQNMNEKA